MGDGADTSTRVVVLTPDVLAKAFHVPECKSVLESWRDGHIRLALNHELLAQYARVLRGLRIPDPIIRRWLVWFTAQDKAEFLQKQDQPVTGKPQILTDILARTRVDLVITHDLTTRETWTSEGLCKGVDFIEARQFLGGTA